MPRRPNARPLIIVSWNDHAADGSWADVEKFHGPSLCHSVGWLYKEDDQGITLAANYAEDQTGNLQYIIKACIVNRQVLAVKRGTKNVRARGTKSVSPPDGKNASATNTVGASSGASRT